MTEVSDTLRIVVQYSENEPYGPNYVATNDELGLVTDGRTFEELLINLREALDVCFEDTDTVTEFNLIPNPRVVITMEMPEGYAKTA